MWFSGGGDASGVMGSGTFVLACGCFGTRAGVVFSWYRDMNHTEGCREFRRRHPEYVERVRHRETEAMLMTCSEYDRFYAYEPVSAWRWKWRQPMTRWVRLLRSSEG